MAAQAQLCGYAPATEFEVASGIRYVARQPILDPGVLVNLRRPSAHLRK
jgi:hypothetical protein